MKTKPLTRFAPVMRERPAREPLQISASEKHAPPQVHLHAEFECDEELSDLSAPFVGGPQHIIRFDFEPAEIGTLAEVYGYRVFRAQRWADEAGKLKFGTLVLRFAHDAFVLAYGSGWGRVVASSAAKAEAIHTEIAALLGAAPKPKKPCFFMLRHDGGSFEADPIHNLPEPLDDEFLRLAYGDDAAAWLGDFAARTVARPGGLSILEGPPGTGKTSLVSEMIRRLRATHLFYVLPVGNDSALTSSELVSFWQSQDRKHAKRVKVVVLEDAERILLGRSSATRDAVAAVLNIADGLLGRMLKVHLLCSINAKFEELDPAIQRPGRLTNYRRFAPLPRDRAVALAALQGSAFSPAADANEFTLAEVLQPSPVASHSGKKRIGFAR